MVINGVTPANCSVGFKIMLSEAMCVTKSRFLLPKNKVIFNFRI